MGWVFNLPKELSIVVVGALPVFELRGAIPLGFYLNVPLLNNFLLSVLGNMLPVAPLLLLLRPLSERLRRIPFCRDFFDWLFARTKKRAHLVEKYEALGLIILVAIPLPMTGAWTGSMAASLFKIKFRYALPAIFLGVIIAGVCVTFLCQVGRITWNMTR